MNRIIGLVVIGLVIFVGMSCKSTSTVTQEPVMGQVEKIDFDLSKLDKDGLIGPANGKVSIDYEFCFPKGYDYEKQLQSIDPELKILPETKGRSGCSKTQSLAIGSTHKPNYKEILLRLSELEFVKRIRRVYYE